ncbi:MAG: hypothetical protein ACJAZR_001171, partial [Sediminicola sp.]
CAVSGCKPTTFPQFNNTFFNLFFDFFTAPSEHTGLQGFMNGNTWIFFLGQGLSSMFELFAHTTTIWVF